MVDADHVHTNELTTMKLTLLDENGNPMILSIKDGKLDIQMDLPGIYIYDSDDISIYDFAYSPGVSQIEHFLDKNPQLILDRFVPISDDCVITYDGVKCYKIGVSSGGDELIDKTLLIRCKQNRKIVSLSICDSNMNQIETMNVTGDNVKNLTINMTYIV